MGYERHLHVMAAHYLFDRNIFIEEHIEPALGPTWYRIMYPVARSFAGYFTRKMNRLEMIPINKDYKGDKKELSYNLRKAIDIVKEFLINQKAVVIFQTPVDMLKTIGRRTTSLKSASKYDDYIPKFNPTVGKIIYELFNNDNLLVPVTPVSIYGGEGLNPFHNMVLNIGPAMNIKSSMNNESDKSPVTDFTDKIERKVAQLLTDSKSAFIEP
jgi:hypothetical protein